MDKFIANLAGTVLRAYFNSPPSNFRDFSKPENRKAFKAVQEMLKHYPGLQDFTFVKEVK